MKGELRKWAGRFGDNAGGAVIALMLLLFPSSPTVLCIAPGAHIAVEDMNTACSAHCAAGVHIGGSPEGGFAASDSCCNCTDLFLTPYGRGAVLGPGHALAPCSTSYLVPENHPYPAPSACIGRPDLYKKRSALCALSPVTPLRC